jgi:hypothetical protein
VREDVRGRVWEGVNGRVREWVEVWEGVSGRVWGGSEGGCEWEWGRVVSAQSREQQLTFSPGSVVSKITWMKTKEDMGDKQFINITLMKITQTSYNHHTAILQPSHNHHTITQP